MKKKNWIYFSVLLVGLAVFMFLPIEKKVGGHCDYQDFSEEFEISEIIINVYGFEKCVCKPVSPSENVIIHLHHVLLGFSKINDSINWYEREAWDSLKTLIISGERIIKGYCQPFNIESISVISNL